MPISFLYNLDACVLILKLIQSDWRELVEQIEVPLGSTVTSSHVLPIDSFMFVLICDLETKNGMKILHVRSPFGFHNHLKEDLELNLVILFKKKKNK